MYKNSLLNKYTITKYLTFLLFTNITYLLLLFVLEIDRLTQRFKFTTKYEAKVKF